MRRLTDIDLRLLRIFCTVVDCNGFQNAQIALNMAQSTLSTHMASLESKLGSRLCKRGRGGFRLTATGEETYLAAVDLFRSIEGFQTKMSRVHGRETERLRIGVIDTVTTNVELNLPAVIAAFSDAHPSVFLDVQVLPPEQLQRAVAEGRRDLVIGPSFQQSANLSYRSLTHELHHLYCGRQHAWFSRDDLTITEQDFHTERFSVRSYQYFDDVYRLGSIGASASVSSMEAQELLLLSGAFVGFLPCHKGRWWVEQKQMRAVRPMEWFTESPFYVAWDDTAGLLTSKRAFVGFLVDQSKFAANAGGRSASRPLRRL